MATNNAVNYRPAQYNIQTGGANGILNNVAPSVTSGVPLISQGSSSQPVFGTAVVEGGGTGNTTFTAYSVICAGTTATGAFQNVSGVGTSGQVLTSNGAGALPTWATSSNAPTPSSQIYLQDDFMGCNPYTSVVTGSAILSSDLCWTIGVTTWGGGATQESGHPGMIGNSASTAASSYNSLWLKSSTTGSLILGGGAITLQWFFKIVNLSTGTNTYTLNIGLGDSPGQNTDQANGIYFKYSNAVNSGNWVIVTANASSRTPTNTATAVTTGWHTAKLVINAAASSVEFFMDGVSQGTTATNIPTTNPVGAMWNQQWGAGTITANSFLVDLFTYAQTLTTPR